ncbi:MAG: phosphoribosylglycinamide formyltransferase [Actinomycetota bacterium]|nr:phosphoribosylglycinamide formyltransferase [Actinomycetota bacterium]
MDSRIVVLASGSGTLLQALLDSSFVGPNIAAVGSDVPDCGALVRARASRVPTFCVSPSDFSTRDEWNAALEAELVALSPDLIVSAGFMRLIGPSVLSQFPGQIINTHPALLPSFPGAHGVRDALAYGVTVTGCTVHFVDAGVDTGEIIAQRAVSVLPTDGLASLHERIKTQERSLLVEVLLRFLATGNLHNKPNGA